MAHVMVFGSFDPLHEGHRDLFRQAREHGDELIVVVSRDSSIRKIKKREPREKEERRVQIVQNEKNVTRAVLGNEDDFLKVVEEHRPDFILLGYDQKTFSEEDLRQKLADRGLFPAILRGRAHLPDTYKSSKIGRS